MPRKSAKDTAATPAPAEESPAAKPKKTRAKKAVTEDLPEPVAEAPTENPAKKKRAAKPRAAKVQIRDEAKSPVEAALPEVGAPIDPIGDTSDGEAYSAVDAAHVESEPQAMAQALAEEIHDSELPSLPPQGDFAPEPTPEHELERLQKILARAGIASRRRAEEMIVEGRVMVNGQVVTQLGVKADPARDHIRVDGKLIAGAERHRYFLLNKPRGYVTTSSDPEGRPTVMQLFEKTHERLYPVGRLDYLSEGLLLVTNDGELANQLTRAALGVEKTYLVKVAGRPTEEELDRLRSGVVIERGKPGSERVETAPASIRQIRQGDNPWYEVVLIEGRNRELRKMFEQIGHFVEKIRRVGYGPLVLDVEPGQFRELTVEEVKALQLTAEGKLKPRRPKASQMLPKDAGKPAEERDAKRGSRKPFMREPQREERPFRRDARQGNERAFGNRGPQGRESNQESGFRSRPDKRTGSSPGFKPKFGDKKSQSFGGRSQFSQTESERGELRSIGPRRGGSRPFRNREESETGAKDRFEVRRPAFRPQASSEESRSDRRRGPGRQGGRPQFERGARPKFERDKKPAFNRGDRPQFRGGDRPKFVRGDKPRFDRSDKPKFERGEKPRFDRGDRPQFKRRNEEGEGFEARPPRFTSRPPGRDFGSRPQGRPSRSFGPHGAQGSSDSRPQEKRFGSGPSSAKRFSSGPPKGKRPFSSRPGKPSFRPGGKSGPKPGRRRP